MDSDCGKGTVMDRNMRIAIVGGSLVGPVTKLLLEREGFTDVTVFESMTEAQSRSGGVMGLRIPTIETLESVGILRRDVIALRDTNTYSYDLGPKNGVPVSRGYSDFPGIVTSWDALHDQLASKVDVQYGREVTGIHESDGVMVLDITAKLGKERSHSSFGVFDLVLFADGRKSTGRTLLDPLRTMEYQGYVVWRGLATPPRPTPTGFNRYYDFTNNRLFSLTGPIIQSGKSYWEFSHNLDRELWQAMAGGSPEDKAYLLPNKVDENTRQIIHSAMRHMPDTFQNLVFDSEISGIPVNDGRFPDRAFFRVGKGYAALLGDALIPVRLQVGAGLNMGLLEGKSLVDTLARTEDLSTSLASWEESTLDALARWTELGRSRVNRLNLGHYEPVRPGWTTAPMGGAFDEPAWVLA
jgi:2-polyprenyl-6-methoxyphenol hydroxylase-like FAD-dependent oxidoreductase